MSYGPHVYRLSVWQHVTTTPSRLDNEGIRRLITPLEMRHVIQLGADGRHSLHLNVFKLISHLSCFAGSLFMRFSIKVDNINLLGFRRYQFPEVIAFMNELEQLKK